MLRESACSVVTNQAVTDVDQDRAGVAQDGARKHAYQAIGGNGPAKLGVVSRLVSIISKLIQMAQ